MSLARKDKLTFGITAAVVAATAVVQYTTPNPVVKFVAAAAALSLLAMNVSSGTEQVG